MDPAASSLLRPVSTIFCTRRRTRTWGAGLAPKMAPRPRLRMAPGAPTRSSRRGRTSSRSRWREGGATGRGGRSGTGGTSSTRRRERGIFRPSSLARSARSSLRSRPRSGPMRSRPGPASSERRSPAPSRSALPRLTRQGKPSGPSKRTSLRRRSTRWTKRSSADVSSGASTSLPSPARRNPRT